MLKNKTVVLAVTGGIAVYKSLDLVSTLRKRDYDIHVVMTKNACHFINPLTFQAMSQNPVLNDSFDQSAIMAHIELAEKADLFIIAPATYNIIGKIAHGIADDLVTTIASAVQCRKILAPAMNVHMFENPILQENLQLLKLNGYEIISPDTGMLACGYEGKGRLRNLDDIIHIITQDHLPEENKSLFLQGKKIVITAGGSVERIDPVRFITNRSSGKMGIRFAEACRDLGAEVTLIYGQITCSLPKDMHSIYAESANDLLNILKQEVPLCDILVMAAAVSDYRMDKIQQHKIKKTSKPITITLIENPDILKTLSHNKKEGQLFIGFAAESDQVLENAKTKLEKKKLDLIIANDISKAGIGFQSDYNEVSLIFSSGDKIDLSRMDKYKISIEILNQIYEHFLI